jgi:hypothetical protein
MRMGESLARKLATAIKKATEGTTGKVTKILLIGMIKTLPEWPS